MRRHGLVLGKFYPLHRGHLRLIHTAAAGCERVTVQVLASSAESVPLAERMRWVRDAFPASDFPHVKVVGAMDDAEVDYASDAAWVAHMRVITDLLDAPVDAVFSGDAYAEELATRLDATWVPVDRAEVTVTGRGIRADLDGQWHDVAPSARATLASRIVVLGAESTGSTTLAVDLAAHLGTPYVAEYGREYSEIRVGGFTAPWRAEEFNHIVDAQREAEDLALRDTPTPLVICDTDILATALWFERYLGRESPEILAQAAQHRPALYVLTGDEIPFVQDGLRDGEHLRHAHQQRFRDVLAAQPVPWIEVHGSPTERLAEALTEIHRIRAAHATFTDPLPERGVGSTSLQS